MSVSRGLTWLLLGTLVLALGSCAGTLPGGGGSDALGPGARLRLTRDITIPPKLLGGLRPEVAFQEGRVRAQVLVDRFKPYCSFSPPRSGGGEQLVQADVFVVESALSGQQTSALDSRLARAESGVFMRVNDTPGLTLYTLRLELRGALQGDGFTLMCNRADERGAGPVKVADLEQSLGSYFELLPAAASIGDENRDGETAKMAL